MNTELDLNAEVTNSPLNSVEDYKFEPIKGEARLYWRGKRPYDSTSYYPAQLKETYGEETDGWMNKIFWGDNLQVMSHMLKEYRGKIQLIYIDPPFDSKADYKKTIEVRGKKAQTDATNFEEKQYGDIWTNDEYLQFMYERLRLLRELLADNGSIYLHCDWHKSHLLRCMMDEVFGVENFVNEIIWSYRSGGASKKGSLPRKHDNILFYCKNSNNFYISCKTERQYLDKPFMDSKKDEEGKYYVDTILRDVLEGAPNIVVNNQILQYNMRPVLNLSKERVDYPTQKPEGLLQLFIEIASKPGDIVFDCFMGSGTTQAVAMKLGRRFLGADINLGAVDTTVKRLISIQKDFAESLNTNEETKYTGFEVYNVNNYDVFRNPIQARDLLVSALELEPLPAASIWDGTKDDRKYKILPVNRLATRQDLTTIIQAFDLKELERRKQANPSKPVEKITLVCMGHEPDLGGTLALEANKLGYKIDVNVLDILRDKQDLQFRRDSEADIQIEGNKLVIRNFYPMNLLEKLSWQKEEVDDWRVLVDSIKIDFNFDGANFTPTVIDIPENDKIVSGVYSIPASAGTIKVKITDLLSESCEKTIESK